VRPPRCVVRRHVLDGELDPVELFGPPRLKPLDRVEDEIIEALGPAAGDGQVRRAKWTS
jgi:hypothetical protein